MAQLEPHQQELEAADASLVYIAAEKRGGIWKPEKHFAEHPSAFPFLLDEDRRVTKNYGLYHRLGKDAINIAHPGTLVVDRSGVIRFIYVGKDQKDRASWESVIKAVKEAAQRI